MIYLALKSWWASDRIRLSAEQKRAGCKPAKRESRGNPISSVYVVRLKKIIINILPIQFQFGATVNVPKLGND